MFKRKLEAAVLMASMVLAGAVGILAPVSASAATEAHAVTATRAAAAPAAVAASADAVAVRSGWFGLKVWGNHCLDSNAARSVYLLPCQVPGNKYQDWNWTEWKAYSPYQGYYYFYSLQDQATGYCLDSNAAGQVYTNPCQAPGNGYQDWYEGTTSETNVDTFTDVATSLALWGDGYDTPRYPVSTYNQFMYNQWNIFQ
jgi:hypothetical protein